MTVPENVFASRCFKPQPLYWQVRGAKATRRPASARPRNLETQPHSGVSAFHFPSWVGKRNNVQQLAMPMNTPKSKCRACVGHIFVSLDVAFCHAMSLLPRRPRPTSWHVLRTTFHAQISEERCNRRCL